MISLKGSVTFVNYPKALIDQVNQRSQAFQLEGLNEGAGPQHPALMLVGEAPGKDEIVTHIPFHGRSGQELMKSLALLQLTRDEVYITSVVRSRPYKVVHVVDKKTHQLVTKYPNRKPTQKEILAQAPFFDYEVNWVQPQIIVTLGSTAAQRILGTNQSLTDIHGQIFNQPIQQLNPTQDAYQWSAKKYQVYCTYHPAAIFYNRKLATQIQRDWEQLKDYIK